MGLLGLGRDSQTASFADFAPALPARLVSGTNAPDGQLLTAVPSEDHIVKLWDAERGEELLTLKGHTKWVFGVAFSRDGKRLASGSFDRTIRIGDAQSLDEK